MKENKMKSSYTQEYTKLNNKIKENREKIISLKAELEETKEMESKSRIDLINEEWDLRNLKYQQNKIVTKKDKLISAPIAILTIIIETILASVIYSIIGLPEQMFFKVLVGFLSVSVGGCALIATILCSNALIRKLQSKLHEYIEQNNTEYKKIVEKIKDENLKLEPRRVENERLRNKIYEIKKMLSQTEETINVDLEKMENIKNEIVNMFVSDEEQNQEITKPYTRIRSKTN